MTFKVREDTRWDMNLKAREPGKGIHRSTDVSDASAVKPRKSKRSERERECVCVCVCVSTHVYIVWNFTLQFNESKYKHIVVQAHHHHPSSELFLSSQTETLNPWYNNVPFFSPPASAV